MVEVSLQHISRIYDAGKRPAVNRVNIDVRDGEFITLVGPSGSGKSTCLRMIAGLEPVNEGTVKIDGKDVTELRPSQRDVAMVFQSYALYPNMTTRQNMAFALENAGMGKEEVNQRVEQAAEMLELTDLLDKKPANMSGGQRQRVSMGRAIVRKPKVFLMDEPLSNLDARLRVSTRAQIASLQRELGVTTIYVTHDQTEAMTMGDRVAVLKDGVLQQVDEPMHLYRYPGNTFVAGFIGSPAMTLFDGAQVNGSEVSLGELCPVPVPERVTSRVEHGVIVGVRPEDWKISFPGAASEVQGLKVTVAHIEQLGAEAFAYVELPTGSAVTARHSRIAVRLDSVDQIEAVQVGDQIRISPKRCSLFDFENEVNLEYLQDSVGAARVHDGAKTAGVETVGVENAGSVAV
ncbi:MAG: ABC transporter ATP-binding protein [Rothia sp. (in: high G+C Gram-positive bacteria)]|nr:ABC transporter ATP-binding protein [Rothia sp. (in: high G+C Gram-positive bacteria)]